MVALNKATLVTAHPVFPSSWWTYLHLHHVFRRVRAVFLLKRSCVVCVCVWL